MTDTYEVTDEQGGSDTATATIDVTPTPTLPSAPLIPLQEVIDGQDFSATPLVDISELGIVDPDGDTPLTITTTSTLPAGLTLNPDGTITGVIDNSASQQGDDPVNNPGVYTIDVDISDGTSTTIVTMVVDVSNPAPITITVIEDQEEIVGQDVSVPTAAAFTDPDGDDLTFTATGLPGGLTIEPVTGVISGTVDTDAVSKAPNGDGIYTVIVTADDGEGGMTTLTFIYTIADLPAIVDPLPKAPIPEPELPAPDGPEALDMIITKAVNEVSSLGSDTGLYSEHPITEALFKINPLGQSVALDSEGHPIADVVSWIERSRDALDNNPLLGDNAQSEISYYGSDARAASVGGGEIVLRTLGYDNRIFLEAIGADGVLEVELESVNGRAVPSWIEFSADNLLQIRKPAASEEINLILVITNKEGTSTKIKVEIDLVGAKVIIVEAELASLNQGFAGQLHTMSSNPAKELSTLLRKNS